MKLKWIMFFACIAFIWGGAVLYRESPEDSVLAFAAWITAGLWLIAAFACAIHDLDED